MSLPTENIFGHTKKLQYILSAIDEVVARKPTATIMDFGCGNGEAVSQYIIDRLPESARYIGVDLHEPSIEHASRRFSKANATFQTTEPAEQADVIVYADILEHLDDPEPILVRHARLLRRDGIAVGSIPNGLGPFELESALDRKFQISNRIAGMMAKRRGRVGSVPYNSDSGHVQFYRRAGFTRMLREAGFRVSDFRNGAFFGAMVTERILRFGGAPLMRANVRLADFLPFWAASTWLFRCEAR
jgi:2-polyprenyl-3-methyl-5-hydroxy-6-metoxy-1,4-benzoquinol methylase